MNRDTLHKIGADIFLPLEIETLNVRGMDDLDFLNLHVDTVAKLMEAAYEAGRVAGNGE